MLGKVFKMAGLYKGTARQQEPDTHFRRACNVWQDKNGKYRPLGDQANLFTPSIPAYYTGPIYKRGGFVKRFKDGIFTCTQVDSSDPDKYANIYSYHDLNGNPLSLAYNVGPYNQASTDEKNMHRNSYPCTVLGNKMFFKTGTLPLLKFDGYQIVRAGLPLPYLYSAQVAAPGITPDHWMKIVHVRLGMDGTIVTSGMLKVGLWLNGGTSATFIEASGGFSELIGREHVSPGFRDSNQLDSNLQDDLRCFVRNTAVNWAWDSVNGTVSCAANAFWATAIAARIKAGDWVMFHESTAEIAGTQITDAYARALQVVSIVGNTINFKQNGKIYSRSNLTWIDRDFSTEITTLNARPTLTQEAASIFVLIYSSTTENGTYLLRKTAPYMIDSTGGITAIGASISSAQSKGYFCGQISQDIAAWYDQGTVKLPFPNIGNGYASALKGLTNYGNLLIGYDDQNLYFNDTSTGGSDEMLSGLSNLFPLGSEFGKIVCVEGGDNFILISRERKNFILTGDLATGNVNIEECDFAAPGAFSSTSALCVKGGVVFASRQGIFYVTSSGAMTEVTADISRLFGVNREFDTDPDLVGFKPYLITDASAGAWDGNIVRLKYDADRNILGVLYTKQNSSNPAAGGHCGILAINLTNGAMYDWPVTPADLTTDIEFIPKYTSTGKFKGSLVTLALASGTVRARLEDNTLPFVEEKFLLTSWQTGGEPSLDKQVKQLKFFGQLSTCKIFHQENWEAFTSLAAIVAPRTNVSYSGSGFEHKQRFNTSRVQALSAGIQFLDNNSSFEGYEVEWDLIQETTKK